jgi:spore maturation protein CgeB
VLFSLTGEYQQFFKVQGIPSYNFSYGVDERIAHQLSDIKEKKFDVTFVGLLGSAVQTGKTRLMESIAAKFRFNWWGPRNVDGKEYPSLHRSYMGKTSGIEMLTIYRQSKIVVNDYVDTANGTAVNLRLYEVLNTGSFLLTRAAENLKRQFGDVLSTFSSDEECIEKIAWHLQHDATREERASVAAEYAMQNYSYKDTLKHTATLLRKHYEEKFNNQYAGTTD